MFASNLFEKLLDGDTDLRAHQSVDRLKDSVARDVESLLNTRCGLRAQTLANYPLTQESVLTFGLQDFVSLSLSKEGDRAQICDDIRRALLVHEPRLQQPVVSVSIAEGGTQRLHFSIQALLIAHEANEVVNFDAVLHPNNLRYHVSNGR